MATRLGEGPKTIKGCEGIAQQPVVDYDRDPRESIHTVAVFFAVAAGYRWGIPKPYLDLIEDKGDRIERRVYWNFDGGSVVTIEGEKVPFGQFWRRIHEPDKSTLAGVINQLAQARAILGVMRPEDRSGKLREWADHPALAEQTRAICRETATIYDEFRASRMPRFIYIEQARGNSINRAYIPIHASDEVRNEILARAGIA